MTNAARDTLRRLDTILADNSEAIHSTMANLSTFTDALARNSGKLDGIVAGLERLTGGGAANAAQVVYDLTAPTQFAAIGGRSHAVSAALAPELIHSVE
jgi:phospholipid/cholesterol/gamma-HCH transport system substrate-binding protein